MAPVAEARNSQPGVVREVLPVDRSQKVGRAVDEAQGQGPGTSLKGWGSGNLFIYSFRWITLQATLRSRLFTNDGCRQDGTHLSQSAAARCRTHYPHRAVHP